MIKTNPKRFPASFLDVHSTFWGNIYCFKLETQNYSRGAFTGELRGMTTPMKSLPTESQSSGAKRSTSHAEYHWCVETTSQLTLEQTWETRSQKREQNTFGVFKIRWTCIVTVRCSMVLLFFFISCTNVFEPFIISDWLDDGHTGWGGDVLGIFICWSVSCEWDWCRSVLLQLKGFIKSIQAR